MNELIKSVREYALAHYTVGGWDYVVEAWDDADIIEAIKGAKTPEAAIKSVEEVVKSLNDYREDIRNS